MQLGMGIFLMLMGAALIHKYRRSGEAPSLWLSGFSAGLGLLSAIAYMLRH